MRKCFRNNQSEVFPERRCNKQVRFAKDRFPLGTVYFTEKLHVRADLVVCDALPKQLDILLRSGSRDAEMPWARRSASR